MTQTNILELARQGDTEAIASLINRQLKPKGIMATVVLEDACLLVMLESPQVLNQQALVSFIRRGIINLDVTFIEKVEIYGQKTGDDFPCWYQEFHLGTAENYQQLTINPHGLTLSINLNGDTINGLTSKNFESLVNKITSDIFSSCNDVFIQRVSISNGSSVITRER